MDQATAHITLLSGSATMPPPATHALQLVVLAGAFVAAAVGVVALPADMLPINQIFLVIDFALVTTWLLVLVTRRKSGGR